MRLIALFLVLFCAAPAFGQMICPPRALPPVAACTGPARVSLAVVGDVLLHEALATRGYLRGFDTLWGAAVPLLRAADIALANLEGPVAPGFARDGGRLPDPGPRFDGMVYSEYPLFNYHPVVIDALREAGIDIVTTANNHALDRGASGLDATLAALDAGRMAQVGAVPGGQERMRALRLSTPAGPLSLIACTFGTNGIADPRGQIPLCYEQTAALSRLVTAEAGTGAGVIVLPHWGQEYSLTPDAAQRRFARAMAGAGAIAVIGTHPHVPQPWEVLDTPRGPVPVIYSTGNFIAAQPPLERATAIMAWLEFCPGAAGPVIGGAGFVPLQMEFEGADPSLTLPRPGMGARAEAGLALLDHMIPGRDLRAVTDCRAPRAPRTAPIPEPDR